jgi:hypothetical protein
MGRCWEIPIRSRTGFVNSLKKISSLLKSQTGRAAVDAEPLSAAMRWVTIGMPVV